MIRNKKFFKFFLFIIVFSYSFIINSYSQSLKLFGNYIKLTVNKETGGFTLFGRNNVEEDWISLLFEDEPPTSFFRFYKEDKRIPFGEGGRGRYAEIEIVENQIIYYWQNDDIKIEIIYKLIASDKDKPADTLIIDLNITNLKYYSYPIDYFFCIDTYLGERSGKHFKLSNNEEINKEKEIKDISEIDYIISHGKNENIDLNIVFNKEKQIAPGRIYFVNWKKVEQSIGLYKVLEGRSFDLKPYSENDSAVFIEYTGISLSPDIIKSYRFILSMQNNVSILKDDKQQEVKKEPDNDKNTDENQDRKSTDNQDNNTDTKEPVIDKELDLINLSLSDLLKLLDDINNKLDSNSLTDDDVLKVNKILNEIKKRRGY